MAELQKIYNLYKRVGETPLECLERFRKGKPELREVPMSYWGRLDPLAEGVLIVAAGDTVTGRREHLDLPKTYSFEVLCGVDTDSYDVLGIVRSMKGSAIPDVEQLALIESAILSLRTIRYPLFSSKTIFGKSLFEHGHDKTLDAEDAPLRPITVHTIKHKSIRTISCNEIRDSVVRKVGLVKGNFRQQEILSSWHHALDEHEGSESLPIISFEADVSTGTYIRTLASLMGKHLGVGALAWSITRTRVGHYTVQDSTM